ncbi:MAG: class I SAM-dependent methyltransferase [Jatrophihabitans sp.]
MPAGPLQRAKHAYAATAQAAGTALTRLHVLDEQPPGLDHRARHWAYSLTRVHDSLAIAELDVPWWTYHAIDAVSDWLRVHQRPLRAFEYGSGASTFWLARRFDQVHSVEHHKGFGDMMAGELAALGNVEFSIVEPVSSDSPRVPSGKEDHAGLDFYDYVHAIDAVEGEFDLVVVDGRARQACLAAAEPRLAAGGVVVYDNSARRRYRPAIEASGLFERRFRGLTPTLPYPEQTSVLFKSRD